MGYKVSIVFRKEESNEDEVKVLNTEIDLLIDVMKFVEETIALEHIRNIDTIVIQRLK